MSKLEELKKLTKGVVATAFNTKSSSADELADKANEILALYEVVEKMKSELSMISTCNTGSIDSDECACENGYSPEYVAKQALAALEAWDKGEVE